VTAVCDIRPERAERLASQYGVSAVLSLYEQMLEREDVDAVLIATPDHEHAGQAIQALEAGKHVLSEIPAAYTLDELRRIIALSHQTGRKYMMGNEVRWFPALESARRMGEMGFWGKVFYGEAEYLHNLKREGWKQVEPDGTPHWRWDPARPQTTLLGGGPHAFDTLRWLSGETGYSEVFAYGHGHAAQGHPEPSTAVCLLKAKSGAAHKITVSYDMVRPYCLYFSLYGDKGSFEGGRVDQNETFFFSDRIPNMDGMTRLGVPYWNHPHVRFQAGHGTSELFMLKEFLAAIREDREPSLGPVEAARSIAPAICAFESIRTGQPVAIPEF
jgi:predicted dehydrogenase